MDEVGKEVFNYTYSAKQQAEIEKIRQKYIPKEENKLEQLRRLDEGAARPGTVAGLAVGIIGALLLGLGMCCTMVWASTLFVPGVIIGVIGLGCAGMAYPVYNKITIRQREKIAPEILRLTAELSKK
jgi:hypothetical protein